jgi:hypothetical protein
MIASLLMEPQEQDNRSVFKYPVIKVVRDTPGFNNSKYYVYGHSGQENQLLQFINTIKS